MSNVSRETIKRPRVQTLDTSIDWITATWTEEAEYWRLFEGMVEVLMQSAGDNGDGKKWQWLSYKGFQGPGYRYGSRYDSHIMQLSSHVASELWREVVMAEGKVTRLDLQVTVKLPDADPTLAKACYDWILGNNDLTGRARYFTYITNSQGGDTLTVNKRSSSRYARLYDKGAESGSEETGRLWRYELELKAVVAEAMATHLSRFSDAHLGSAIIVEVWDFFEKNGVGCTFDKKSSIVPMRLPEIISSNAKTLTWLSTQVGPAVERLAKNGLLPEAVEAMGLGRLVGQEPDYGGYE